MWLARAVRPGTPADGRLLLEHRVGAVPIEDCDCPQPAFADCSKPVQKRDQGAIHDPVVFENRAAEPVDVFYWNGTCEELVSWDEIGGVQAGMRKPLLSTQGHAFRLRSASSRRMLMAHTLNDLVIKGCEDDEASAAQRAHSLDGLESLRLEARFYEREAALLRQRLSAALAEVAMAASSNGRGLASGGLLGGLSFGASASNATAASSTVAVSPAGGLLHAAASTMATMAK